MIKIEDMSFEELRLAKERYNELMNKRINEVVPVTAEEVNIDSYFITTTYLTK